MNVERTVISAGRTGVVVERQACNARGEWKTYDRYNAASVACIPKKPRPWMRPFDVAASAWQHVGHTADGADVYVAPVGAPLPDVGFTADGCCVERPPAIPTDFDMTAAIEAGQFDPSYEVDEKTTKINPVDPEDILPSRY